MAFIGTVSDAMVVMLEAAEGQEATGVMVTADAMAAVGVVALLTLSCADWVMACGASMP